MNATVCAITITFNPDLEIFEQQLQSLQDQCNTILVDNGSEPTTLRRIEQLSQRYGCRLLALSENEGIAAAQNHGVKLIENEIPECEYLLFLDHDSIPNPDFVAAMVEEYSRLERLSGAIGVLGPAIYEPRAGAYYGFHVLRGLRYARVGPEAMADDAIVCATINSAGTFCPLRVMQSVGPYDERLFIDHVETEWCFRASHLGYWLYGSRNVDLVHQMGDDVLHLKFAHKRVNLPYRSPHRHRYLMRNSIEMMRRNYIPTIWKCYCIVKIALTFLLFGVFADDSAKQRRAIFGGISDGLRRRLGKIPAPQ